VLLCSIVLTGCAWGCLSVGVPALAVHLGSARDAGILLTLTSVGSLAGGLAYGGRTWGAPLERRYAALLAGIAVSAVPLVLVDDLRLAAPLAAVLGLAWAPTMSCQYALVGREKYEGRDVLKVEYYPMKMFTGGRGRPNRQLRERNKEIGKQMNKVSIVTLWVDQEDRQIVKYDFQNVDADFFPGQWLMQLEGLNAGMEMSQPFPGVWLPRVIRIGFDIAFAGGNVKGTYSSEYYDYQLAEVNQRIR